MQNPESPTAISSYYDDYSSWYDGERREGYYSLINALEFERIAPHVRDHDALEIGCGTGLILERTHAMARNATGVDLSQGMAGVSRSKGLTVANASATALPFPDNSFDVVYSCKVLPHVPAIRDAVGEIDRVLRPGGRAFLEFYSPYSLKALAYRLVRLRHRDPDPVYVRFDSIPRIASYLPSHMKIASARGVRIFAPVRYCYTVPGVRRVFEWLERRFCDSRLARFGGYLLVEIVRTTP